ncbi:YqgE/AlgH family protein [Actinoplanes sp. NPDC049265]|uniref:YqgE/AlgH family protein n=1 Tax=Actinoplanes sp. NPDC049265 TaxID=3363902 RepID=UPI00371991B8
MSEVANPALSRVVLIGVSEYRHLPQLPAVRNNVDGFGEVLRDNDYWGVPPENCHVLLDPASPGEVSRVVREAAAAVDRDGLLLVYFSGHGLVDPADDDKLILALPACDPDAPHEEGLPYDWIRWAVAGTRARRRLVILDCCYSGRADSELGSGFTGTDAVADKAVTDGTCLLVSAPANRRARAPHGEIHTAFTGELLRFLREGYQPGPREATPAALTVETVWRSVRDAMLHRGFERPEMRARDFGTAIALVHNARLPRRNLAGTVLYAAPWFIDDELGQRAILVLRHNSTGALGVCLTRPDREIPPEFPVPWRTLISTPTMLFNGGPVARDGYILLTMLRSGAPHPLRFTPLRERDAEERLGTIALSEAPDDLADTVATMRVFVGYLGWRPGELEEYIERGELIVSRRPTRQVFTERPGELWQSLQAGR